MGLEQNSLYPARPGADLRAVFEGEFADKLLGDRGGAASPGMLVVALQLDIRQVPPSALTRRAHLLKQACQRRKLLPHQAVSCTAVDSH